MSKFKEFEEIKAWQLARKLASSIYLLKNDRYSKDFGFKDQMQRSAVSVMANIAEGFERFSNKEFAQFLNIAKGSAGELRSHLYVAVDKGYITEQEFDKLKESCETVSKHIWKLMKYIRALK